MKFDYSIDTDLPAKPIILTLNGRELMTFNTHAHAEAWSRGYADAYEGKDVVKSANTMYLCGYIEGQRAKK